MLLFFVGMNFTKLKLFNLLNRYRKKIDPFARVSDPYSFDPDPAFEARDQSGSGSNPDPGL